MLAHATFDSSYMLGQRPPQFSLLLHELTIDIWH